MAVDNRASLRVLLERLEAIMRASLLWSDEMPPAHAFRSGEPFCIDTMSFWCWLQYVFIPKVRGLLDSGQPLPPLSGILPMAEEVSKSLHCPTTELLQVVGQIDACFGPSH